MSLTLIGTIKAHLPIDGRQEAKYVPIGVLFKDDDGNYALKIDAIPVEKRWNGWANVFLSGYKAKEKIEKPVPDNLDDDIPF
jgi:hypothetical protein